MERALIGKGCGRGQVANHKVGDPSLDNKFEWGDARRPVWLAILCHRGNREYGTSPKNGHTADQEASCRHRAVRWSHRCMSNG